MNISRLWLEAFLRRPLEATELAERLTMLGAPVDAIEPLHPGLGDIVIGLVEEIRVHPNADRLKLCVVDDGSGTPKHVVCGATNVAVGGKYPFAPIGATLPKNFVIERRKIRGEVSEGMLCSARELGLGQDHEGLLELSTTARPGTPLRAVLAVADDRLVVDVTPNRPDLLGHKGVARELAASFGVAFRLPEIPGSPGPSAPAPRRVEGDRGLAGGVTMAVEDPIGCPRLLGAVLRDVKVGPSPAWLTERIAAVGMRSINNVVDATNYVMFELNQPMHAYDIARLQGPSVIARRARHGERLVTLDGVSRLLTEDMTVIADEGGAIGVAGVMGAAHVEVSPSTTEVFLECAYFDPARIRRTRRTLDLSTEASQRFERGVDRWAGAEALRRCIEVIQATASGSLTDFPADIWPQPATPPRLTLRPERVAQVLGVEFPVSVLERYLVAIGAAVLSKPDAGRLVVDVPGWRPDLTQEIDLVEEIARLHGYGRFPEALRAHRPTTVPEDPLDLSSRRLRQGLVSLGLYETQAFPLVAPEAPDSVSLLNPLNAEESALRRRLLPGLIKQIEANWSGQVREVRLFEIGTVFTAGDPGGRPHEACHVAGVISGAREPADWTEGGRGPDVDFWDLKGLFESAVSLALPDGALQVDGESLVALDSAGAAVGRAERIPVAGPPWAAPIFGFEILLVAHQAPVPKFRPLPSTPAVERDLALILTSDRTLAEVEAHVRKQSGALLESVTVFDEYRGSGIPAGTRSVAVRLVFRAPDRTLRDMEVDAVVSRVVASLEDELGIQLRTA